MKGNAPLLLLLGVGGLVWYTSQSQASTGTPSSGTTGGVPPTPPSAPPVQPVQTALPPVSVPTTPVYSGPSLAQIYQTLVAAVIQGHADGDTEVDCTSGMSGLGLPIHPGQVAPILVPGVLAPRIMPGQTTTSTTTTAPTACTSPLATPDVWSWYLINRAGIPQVPGSNVAFAGQDLSQKIDGPTYWQTIAPFLQKAIPGLSGLRGIAPMRLQRVVPVPRSYYYGGWGR